MAMLAYSMPPSAAAAADAPGTPASSRPAGRAGRARTTASAVISSGAAAEPTVSRQPVAVRASSRTVARVRMTAPEASASTAGSVPSPPASVVNTGGRFGGRGSGLARALRLRRGGQQGCRGLGQRAVRRRGRGQRAEGRVEGQFLRPARVDPAEQRIDQPVDHLGAEPGPDVGGDGRVAVPRRGRPVQVLAGPGQPLSRQHPGASQVPPGARSAGTPMNWRCGSGRMAPRVQMAEDVVPGVTSWSPRPTSLIRPVPSGRRMSSASAPASTATPATSETASLPPSRGDPSSTVTRTGASRRKNAAASPAIPPPTMTTCGRVPSAAPSLVPPSVPAAVAPPGWLG